MAQHSNHFFTEAEQDNIIAAVQKAEKETSGEIKVHVERRCKKNLVFKRASKVFTILKMHETAERNGVLFYLASADKHFAIIGDKGIDEKVPDDFWEDVRDTVIKHFKDNKFAEGMGKGILMAGEKLQKYFPYQEDDINELSDDISFGEN